MVGSFAVPAARIATPAKVGTAARRPNSPMCARRRGTRAKARLGRWRLLLCYGEPFGAV